MREYRTARRRRRWKKHVWLSFVTWSQRVSSGSRRKPRFTTISLGVRIVDRCGASCLASCWRVPSHMNWVLLGFRRSRFDDIQARTESIAWRARDARSLEATRFPTRTIERHLRTGGLRSLVVPRSGICPLCTKCTEADRGRIPAGRRSGQVPDSTQSIHDEQRGRDPMMKDRIHANAEPSIPNDVDRRPSRIGWSTVSNAALTSSRANSVICCLSMAEKMSDKTRRRADSVECDDRNPTEAWEAVSWSSGKRVVDWRRFSQQPLT